MSRNIAHVVRLFVVFVLFFIVGVLTAHGGTCDSVRDPDQRAYCRAVTRGDRNACLSIRDLDLRATCRAIVDANRTRLR